MVNSKHSFWIALVFTIIIFSLGIFFGFFIESQRSDFISENILNSEISILDEQIRSRAIDDLNVSCKLSKESLFDFADRIYDEALILENYDSSAKFLDSFKMIHRKYDLLRTMVWLEAEDIRENCQEDFYTIVYFYDYDIESIEQNSLQVFYSRLALDLKQKYPDKVLLIPIASNLGLSSVDIILEQKGIEEKPVLLVNNKVIISDQITFDELENIVFESHKQ